MECCREEASQFWFVQDLPPPISRQQYMTARPDASFHPNLPVLPTAFSVACCGPEDQMHGECSLSHRRPILLNLACLPVTQTNSLPSRLPRHYVIFVVLQSDLKGLSGGERSYSTLAFTMALENVISVPFACLDEFDVVRPAFKHPSLPLSFLSVSAFPCLPLPLLPFLLLPLFSEGRHHALNHRVSSRESCFASLDRGFFARSSWTR